MFSSCPLKGNMADFLQQLSPMVGQRDGLAPMAIFHQIFLCLIALEKTCKMFQLNKTLCHFRPGVWELKNVEKCRKVRKTDLKSRSGTMNLVPIPFCFWSLKLKFQKLFIKILCSLDRIVYVLRKYSRCEGNLPEMSVTSLTASVD